MPFPVYVGVCFPECFVLFHHGSWWGAVSLLQGRLQAPLRMLSCQQEL